MWNDPPAGGLDFPALRLMPECGGDPDGTSPFHPLSTVGCSRFERPRSPRAGAVFLAISAEAKTARRDYLIYRVRHSTPGSMPFAIRTSSGNLTICSAIPAASKKTIKSSKKLRYGDFATRLLSGLRVSSL
jgi:hypothetical protein